MSDKPPDDHTPAATSLTSGPPAAGRQAAVSPASSPQRCGYVALVGRPNAGKSTLFNAFVGQRLSIVTPRPQTTRSRILGILTSPHRQLIFLDTPGLLEPRYKLHEAMVHQIELAARQADLVLLLLDATQPRDRHELIAQFITRLRLPLIAVLNKIDSCPPERLEIERQARCREFGLEQLLPISALRGDNLTVLRQHLEALLPIGPKLYPDDMIAEQPERFFVSELIREAAFDHLEDELPYSLSVAIEAFEERSPKTYIAAVLHVERDSQKGIVIGRQGSRLRAIGTQARRKIEELLQTTIYLDLRVKVRPDWRKKEKDLKEFGYL